MIPSLDRFRRIVIKVGSSLVVDHAAGTPKRAWLEALGDDLAGLHRTGADVLVVSSGAIALGRRVLKTAGWHAEARRQPGGRGRGPDRLGQDLGPRFWRPAASRPARCS